MQTFITSLTSEELTAPLGTLLCNAITVTGSPPFLTLPSPRAKVGLLCEDGWSRFRRPYWALTSDHHADVTEPTCSTSKAPRPNPLKAKAALSNWSWPSAPHQAETRLCISLPFVLAFIENIAQKRRELNCDKTTTKNINYAPGGASYRESSMIA